MFYPHICTKPLKKTEFHTIVSILGKTLGQKEKKTIYIVGPCIAGGGG